MKITRFTFPVSYYCRLQADFDDPIPERGFKGYMERPMELNSANTVVAVMHAPNFGYPGGIEWSEDSPHFAFVRIIAHAPEIKKVIDKCIAPFLEVVRSIGLPIMYISGPPVVDKYPQHREISARVAEYEVRLPESPDRSWEEESEREQRGAGWGALAKEAARVQDIAPTIAPHPRDLVISTTAQATTLLRERGIWNILYTGFDTGGCVVVAAGGMSPMRELGYRCILLRDCTTGGELAETAPTRGLTTAAIQGIGMGGYTADSRDVMKAIKEAKCNM